MLVTRLGQLLERLGLLFVGALTVAMLALAAFAKLAEEVLESEFKSFDRAVLVWVGHHVHPSWTPFVMQLSSLGTPLGITLLGTLFGVGLLARRRTWDAATLLVVLFGGSALTVGLKALFRQPRPQVFPPLSVEASYSFPSGHALLSLCFFGFLGFWVVAQSPRTWWRWLAGALIASVAVLISLSRLYLGVHWPTDVVAGNLVALFWLSSCLAIRAWLSRQLAGTPKA